MSPIKNPVARFCVFVVGVVSLIIGAIGIFVPLLPTTPFALIAVWCFLRSSASAHEWIYRNAFFGKTLRDWERTRSIALSTKLLASAMILISIFFIWLKVENDLVKYFTTLFLLLVSLFILSRKGAE